MTNKHIVNKIFKDLRKAGYTARQNFRCCQTCAWSALSKELNSTKEDEKVVFYHQQDAQRFKDTGSLMLAWSGNGTEIANIIQTYAKCNWNGSKAERMEIIFINQYEKA